MWLSSSKFKAIMGYLLFRQNDSKTAIKFITSEHSHKSKRKLANAK